jgi:hypothetical protein
MPRKKRDIKRDYRQAGLLSVKEKETTRTIRTHSSAMSTR